MAAAPGFPDFGPFCSIGQSGLRVVVRRADHERPLCGEVEGSDVLKELPKFSLGSYAHSSIRVQEGQPSPRENSFSPLRSGRNFSLFSRVVALGLFTSGPARDPKSALRRPVVSEPVHFGILAHRFRPLISWGNSARHSQQVGGGHWGWEARPDPTLRCGNQYFEARAPDGSDASGAQAASGATRDSCKSG